MSLNNFCHNCGKKMESGWKACPFCSTSLASLSEQPKTQQQQHPSYNDQLSTVALVENGEEDSDSYIDTMAHYQARIDGLQVDIEKPRNINKDTIEALAKNQFVNVSNEKRIIPPTLSPEEAIKQFQNEASAIRPV
jgi:hypothetical protein